MAQTAPFAIAIDGPSGAGKSTIARLLAKKLQYVYVDTGALYRSIALYMLRQGVDPASASAVEPLLGDIRVELFYRQEEQRVRLNGEDVSEAIRTPAVSMAASAVSALPAVRRFLLDLQRGIAARQPVIMDGRDIGTVVLPNAALKVFLTASPQKRAERRYAELKAKGEDVTFTDVLADLEKRDHDDASRAVAPLKPATDAVRVDTSDWTLEEAVAAIEALVRERVMG